MPETTPAVDPMTGMPNTEMNPDYDPNIEGPAAAAMTADPAMTGGYNFLDNLKAVSYTHLTLPTSDLV